MIDPTPIKFPPPEESACLWAEGIDEPPCLARAIFYVQAAPVCAAHGWRWAVEQQKRRAGQPDAPLWGGEL